MICPKCKIENNFKIDKSSIYCIAKIDGKLCNYTLTKKQKDDYRKEQSSLMEKPKIRAVNKARGFTIKKIAELNDVHINTVRKHLNEFDIIPDTKPTRYKFNQKLLKENWSTLKKKGLAKFVKVVDFHGYEIFYDDTDKPII